MLGRVIWVMGGGWGIFSFTMEALTKEIIEKKCAYSWKVRCTGNVNEKLDVWVISKQDKKVVKILLSYVSSILN